MKSYPNDLCTARNPDCEVARTDDDATRELTAEEVELVSGGQRKSDPGSGPGYCADGDGGVRVDTYD